MNAGSVDADAVTVAVVVGDTLRLIGVASWLALPALACPVALGEPEAPTLGERDAD